MFTKNIARQLILSAVVTGGLITSSAGAQSVQDWCQALTSSDSIHQTNCALESRLSPLGPHLVSSEAENTPGVAAANDEVRDSTQVIASSEIDHPMSVAIVVDSSSRIQPFLPGIRRTGILLTQNVLGPDAEAALIGYNDQVDRLLDFTSDDNAIEKAVGNIQAGTSGSHLYDALAQAVDLLQTRPSSRRRVIVVVAEAMDAGSDVTLQHVMRDAHLASVTIYSVGLSSTSADLRAPEGSGAPPSGTPPGIFALPPFPGSVQTPSTEAFWTGNINLGAAVAWGAKHATSPLRENPLEAAATSTDGSYQSAFRDKSLDQAIDNIGAELHGK